MLNISCLVHPFLLNRSTWEVVIWEGIHPSHTCIQWAGSKPPSHKLVAVRPGLHIGYSTTKTADHRIAIINSGQYTRTIL